MASIVRTLRLYERDDETGMLEDLEISFDVDEHFGGTIPGAGDHIVNQFVSSTIDRRKVENRTIYDVITRYFFAVEADEPDSSGSTQVTHYVGALVVKERPAVESEMDIACRT